MVRLEYEVVGFTGIDEHQVAEYLNAKARDGRRLKHFSVVYSAVGMVDYHLVFEVEE